MPLVFSLKDCKGEIIHHSSSTQKGKLSVQFQGMEIYLLWFFLKCSISHFSSNCPHACTPIPVPGRVGFYLLFNWAWLCVCRKRLILDQLLHFTVPSFYGPLSVTINHFSLTVHLNGSKWAIVMVAVASNWQECVLSEFFLLSISFYFNIYMIWDIYVYFIYILYAYMSKAVWFCEM